MKNQKQQQGERKMLDITQETEKSNLRPIREIIQDLTKPIAFKHLGKRTQGNKDIWYISWYDAVSYFNFITPNWNYAVTDVKTAGGKLVIVVRVSIQASDGIYFREATGQEDEDLESYGDSSSNAEAQAIKRAFAKFGFGLYLYNKDSIYHPSNPKFSRNYETVFTAKNAETIQGKDESVKPPQTASNAPEKAIEPVKQTVTTAKIPVENKVDRITDAQLSSLLSMTTKFSEQGINEREIAEEVSSSELTRYDDLSKTQAGEAIKLIQAKVKMK